MHVSSICQHAAVALLLVPPLVVVQPQLSFDTLRVRWGLSDDIAWLMQEDPDLYTRYDGQQEQVANTGFWMLKNDRRTKQMLEDLIHCPERVSIFVSPFPQFDTNTPHSTPDADTGKRRAFTSKQHSTTISGVTIPRASTTS